MRYPSIIAALLFTATAANAQEYDEHVHDGFYLRLQVGGGHLRATAADFSPEVAVKGASANINAEIGFALFNNFILYGKLYGAGAPNPSIQVGDLSVDNANEEWSQNFGAVGLGVTYYFMPANIYLSGAISYTQLSITEQGENVAETDLGGGLHLGIGKEWWVSKNWGLGIGAELALGRIRDDSNNDNWNVTNVSIVLSATYN
ncbi:outer membrane beta-barrel protein [Myxococcus sp. AM009]|uniref:outer membrane beta-barrel protein n=1 Tax=unclassified Myxococcus TaxID=2648731 RepID=UPI001595843F|nr:MULTISPECIES: outer membrane beta-barrel protein [unclassified Myxococcus]NVJ01927.1 outer membrane beta-barrel protein [Myxococcus sp. AM009]NVJ14528.1 outer membrane beta-barrel protein [Myxococcus sp. AM010]